jgi:hypothetical protein
MDFIDNMDREISIEVAVLLIILWVVFITFHGWYSDNHSDRDV